jgi:hypothetical protein
MKKFGFAVVALCAAAGAAHAIDITAEEIGSGLYTTRADTAVYSHTSGSYSAFNAANYLGFDDYTTTLSPGQSTASLTTMKFVGGVTTANTSLRFNFYDAAGSTLVNSFEIGFGQAGNFIWTITGLGGFNVASKGVMEVVGVGNATGQWFLSQSATTVGSDDRSFGDNTAAFQHSFQLSVPAPGSLAILGLGGLVAGRRRR